MDGTIYINRVFENGAVELLNRDNQPFKVNGQRIKHYFEGEMITKGADKLFLHNAGDTVAETQRNTNPNNIIK